jgi:hypothetical protein
MSDPRTTRGGIPVTLEFLGDKQVVVVSEAPSPPGSQFEVLSEAGAFTIKVHGCKKLPEHAGFRIEGRPVNLTKQVREALRARS